MDTILRHDKILLKCIRLLMLNESLIIQDIIIVYEIVILSIAMVIIVDMIMKLMAIMKNTLDMTMNMGDTVSCRSCDEQLLKSMDLRCTRLLNKE
jgi:hypothetical protein